MIDAISCAYMLAFLESIVIGCTYRYFINIYDPKKQLQNPFSFLEEILTTKNTQDTCIRNSALHRQKGLLRIKAYNINMDNKYDHSQIDNSNLADANILAFILMVIVIIYPVYFLTKKAAVEMVLTSPVPLIICLELEATSSIYGRAHRHEIDKNVESLRRWIYIIPICSIILSIFSGFHTFYFFLLVLMLKFIMNTCCIIIRILRDDPAVKHDSAIKEAFQFIGGIYALFLTLILSAAISYYSPNKNTHMILMSSFLSIIVGYLYYSISVI